MVIIGSKEGQFANRVLHFAHVTSACKSGNIRIVHPYFEEFLPYFPKLKGTERIQVLRKSGFWGFFTKVFLFFIKALIKLKIYNLGFLEVIYYERYDQGAPVIDLSSPEIQQKAKKKILVLYGWLFRDVSGFKQNREYILDLFSIDEKYIRTTTAKIAEIRSGIDILVGVHIRRGDYKQFEQGRWYYEDAVYLEKMSSMAQQLTKKGLSFAFLLCSNEKLDLKVFKGLHVFHLSNSFILDFLLLSLSDFIIGPPSTFSAMASLFGDVPLQFIEAREAVINMEDFEATAGFRV